MQITGNVLVLLLLPITMVASYSLRGTHRVAGPDVMGPAFAMAVSVALRWLLAAVLIGLCVGRGGFDGLVPSRVLQGLIVAALFFALDWAASVAVMATSRSLAQLTPAQGIVGLCIGYGLPLLTVLLLLVPVNAPGAMSAGAVRSVVAVLLVTALPAWAYFGAIDRATLYRRERTFAEGEAERDRVIQTYAATLDALPPDAPLERYLPYFDDPQCPGDVRDRIMQRVNERPDLDAQLLAMLAGDRRAGALRLISQTSRLFEPGQVAAIADASARLAGSYRDRFVTPDSRAATECAESAELAVYFARARSVPGVDFRPAIEAWRDTLARVQPADDRVRSARYEVAQWLEFDARPTGGPP